MRPASPSRTVSGAGPARSRLPTALPYSSNADLPAQVREAYSERCQTVFRETWNKTYASSSDEDKAFRFAHTAAKNCMESTRAMSKTQPLPKAAIRTISETKEVRIIEGLGIPFGGPFGGRDTYGTFASVRTDFVWDRFPPDDFTRPVTFNHGFDPEIGLTRLGGWKPVRTDEDGVWIQAQLDKRAKY